MRKRNSRWARVGEIAGAILAVLGVVSAIAGLPNVVTDALGRSQSKKTQLELEAKRAEVATAAPRLDVSYLFLADSLVSVSSPKRRILPREASSLLAFPMIQNEFVKESGSASARRCLAGYAGRSLAVLVLENRGKRDATDIKVTSSRLQLKRPVRVREEGSRPDDYLEVFRAAARSKTLTLIELPRTLAPGDGALIPLWILESKTSARWCVTSRAALIPTTVRFVDPVLGSVRTLPVRRLANPVLLAEGVEGRG
ncbi:MAG: hypothetical protein M3540_09250 [Actinomycetota bacterium]|nr:hypothetical protein [Actinomycetota bacterium]